MAGPYAGRPAQDARCRTAPHPYKSGRNLLGPRVCGGAGGCGRAARAGARRGIRRRRGATHHPARQPVGPPVGAGTAGPQAPQAPEHPEDFDRSSRPAPSSRALVQPQCGPGRAGSAGTRCAGGMTESHSSSPWRDALPAWSAPAGLLRATPLPPASRLPEPRPARPAGPASQAGHQLPAALPAGASGAPASRQYRCRRRCGRRRRCRRARRSRSARGEPFRRAARSLLEPAPASQAASRDTAVPALLTCVAPGSPGGEDPGPARLPGTSW